MLRKKQKQPDVDVALLTSLNFNPRNPRTITPRRLDALAKSLAEFGDLSGFVLNTTTGRFVGGHQRFAAFAQAELPAVITERLPEPDKVGTTAYGHIDIHGTRFAYREVAWDEPREAAANIAANAHGGEFDDAALTGILKELRDSGNLGDVSPIDADVIGLDDARLNELLREEPPPPPTKQAVKRGPTTYRCPACGHEWNKAAAK